MNNYTGQHRGNASAYATYFAGMDSSMQQKVALTTAFFPTRGRIADMGSGSGRGTYDLACLYPELELVGVDINPVSVEMSRQTYQRANLRYEAGDIADPVFAEGTLDGVLDSSVLHHVTSFNDFSLQRLATCLRNQVAALRPGGVLIIRDFVVPDGPERVVLELPDDDGKSQGSVPELSTASLFERFAATFRSSQHRAGGVSFENVANARKGRARFRLGLRDAAEFVLRKDYRTDWDTELLEEYTYYSQVHFEQALRGLGLRVLASVPIHNPWIVANRYRGKIALFDDAGAELEFPPTNYFIVGEKIGNDQAIALEPQGSRELQAPRFFVPRTYRDTRNGELLALAERPGRTLDLIPWLVRGGRVHVLAKKGFPRPLLALAGRTSGFITEPIAAITDESEATDAAVTRILGERAGIARDAIVSIAPATRYFTSPGGLDECVNAVLAELDPAAEARALVPYGDLGDSGSVRELDAAQLLRAAQVGGTFDARLEIGAYAALARAGQALDAWIGAAIEPPLREVAIPHAGPLASVAPVFEPSEQSSSYLRFMQAEFVARAADGRELARASREYVVPRERSPRTVSVLPLVRTPQGVHVGLEPRMLPAVQRFTGNPLLLVCPAYRLPEDARTLPEIERFVREHSGELGFTVDALVPLGGPYVPSAGATPELVTPFVAHVLLSHDTRLVFASLRFLQAIFKFMRDAHTKIALLRLAHALGRD